MIDWMPDCLQGPLTPSVTTRTVWIRRSREEEAEPAEGQEAPARRCDRHVVVGKHEHERDRLQSPVRLRRLADPQELRHEQRLQARRHEVHLFGGHRHEAPVFLPGLVVDLPDLREVAGEAPPPDVADPDLGRALAEPLADSREALERLLLEREPEGQEVLGPCGTPALRSARRSAAGCRSSSPRAANRSRPRAARPRRSTWDWSGRAAGSSSARGPRPRRPRRASPPLPGRSRTRRSRRTPLSRRETGCGCGRGSRRCGRRPFRSGGR